MSPKVAEVRGAGQVALDSAFKAWVCGPPGPAPPACPRGDWLSCQRAGPPGVGRVLRARDETLFQLVPGKAVPASMEPNTKSWGSVGSAEEGSGAFLGTSIN
ncbi:unnamed protein product [Rangifer tarandus platyrhynchus]|uniref:Uncharacterized protein n=2 Tax=Rangifer tarandus platyrhynchus TaxID=3082113 RepID=A0ACB0EYI8_RANTA|nr:unnamed protein product [Rangifer tarandus platyrhynchus]CAI9705780.1 unnamed protein product [Rangifer tarandus platyrhynchus]